MEPWTVEQGEFQVSNSLFFLMLLLFLYLKCIKWVRVYTSPWTCSGVVSIILGSQLIIKKCFPSFTPFLKVREKGRERERIIQGEKGYFTCFPLLSSLLTFPPTFLVLPELVAQYLYTWDKVIFPVLQMLKQKPTPCFPYLPPFLLFLPSLLSPS